MLLSSQAIAEPQVYLDETSFLNELAAMGYTAVNESFEDDAAWGTVRTPAKAPAVTSQGAVWTSNNLSSEITTDNGPALTGCAQILIGCSNTGLLVTHQSELVSACPQMIFQYTVTNRRLLRGPVHEMHFTY